MILIHLNCAFLLESWMEGWKYRYMKKQIVSVSPLAKSHLFLNLPTFSYVTYKHWLGPDVNTLTHVMELSARYEATLYTLSISRLNCPC